MYSAVIFLLRTWVRESTSRVLELPHNLLSTHSGLNLLDWLLGDSRSGNDPGVPHSLLRTSSRMFHGYVG